MSVLHEAVRRELLYEDSSIWSTVSSASNTCTAEDERSSPGGRCEGSRKKGIHGRRFVFNFCVFLSRYNFSDVETKLYLDIVLLFQDTAKTTVDLPKPSLPSSASSKPEPKTVVITQTLDVKTLSEITLTKSINERLNQQKLKDITSLSLTVSTELSEVSES